MAVAQATERPIVLVDGSNVIHSGAWIDHAGDDLHVRGKRFVDACASWASGEDVDVVVVFDGTGPFQVAGEQRVTPRCSVVATVGNTADSWIEREAAVFRAAGRDYRIVSDDNALRDAATGRGMSTASEAFVHEVLATAAAAPVPEVEVEGSTAGLARHVDAAALEQLEKLRRGEA
jgi:predicted RNA-binding protein with PIN domain